MSFSVLTIKRKMLTRRSTTNLSLLTERNALATISGTCSEAKSQASTEAADMIKAMMPIMMLLMNLTTIAIVWFGAKRIDIGEMQVGSLMAFLQYAMQILFSLLMVSFLFVMMPRASASAGSAAPPARCKYCSTRPPRPARTRATPR